MALRLGLGPTASLFLGDRHAAGVHAGREDVRPFALLGALGILLVAASLVPTSRAWLQDNVLAPLDAQVGAADGSSVGYTVPSLVFWAFLGAAFAWAAYTLTFQVLRVPLDPRFFAALAPYLLFGPLLHALLVADALPDWRLLEYAATEPPIYLTTGALALAGFAVGHALKRTFTVAALVGLLACAPLVVLAAAATEPANAQRAGILLLVAAASALVVGGAFYAWRKRDPLPAVLAVVGAHALDGATTWMVLRDPFSLGFDRFAEKNPVSQALVDLANGWPYFAIKLALPVALLLAVRVEEGQQRLHAFLLLAVFVLGYGPGMSNLLQVLFG